MEGWGGERKSWGHWGRLLHQEEDPLGARGSLAAQTPVLLMCLHPPVPSLRQTREGRGGVEGGGDGKLSRHPVLGQTHSLFPSPPPALKHQALFPDPFISCQEHKRLGPPSHQGLDSWGMGRGKPEAGFIPSWVPLQAHTLRPYLTPLSFTLRSHRQCAP